MLSLVLFLFLLYGSDFCFSVSSPFPLPLWYLCGGPTTQTVKLFLLLNFLTVHSWEKSPSFILFWRFSDATWHKGKCYYIVDAASTCSYFWLFSTIDLLRMDSLAKTLKPTERWTMSLWRNVLKAIVRRIRLEERYTLYWTQTT